MAFNPTAFRQAVRSQLLPSFLHEGRSEGKSEALCTNLEIGVYNYAVREAGFKKLIKKWSNPAFVHVYMDRLRTVCRNMDHALAQLATGEWTMAQLATMTHVELAPDHWRPLLELKKKRDDSRFDVTTQASTDMFTCRKCKSKRCTYYEMQTRSADEPATIFVTCVDCGKHWKC